MHKDTKEALERLEKELLAEETPELDDEDLDLLLEEFLDEEETAFADHPAGYQNYANGYRAYNSDQTDRDLDIYSDEILEEPQEFSLFLKSVTVLALGGAAMSLAWILLRCL